MDLKPVLLACHIAAGTAALIGAIVAVTAKGARWRGNAHRYAGRLFVLGMTAVFLTAVPMAVMDGNLFLLLIAVFSMYLAFAGWRLAPTGPRIPGTADRVAVIFLLAAGAAMLGYGLHSLFSVPGKGAVLLTFGGIAVAMGVGEGRQLRRGWPKGRTRTARHLTFMLADTIATVTAVSVVNFTTLPPLVTWLGPTVLITPLISRWSRRAQAGERRPS